MVLASTSSIARPYPKFAIQAMRLTPSIVRCMPWRVFLHLTARNVSTTEYTQEYTKNTAQMVGPRGFRQVWKPIASALTPHGRPAGPEVPCLLVLGSQDKTGMLQSEMTAWANEEPNTELVIIPNAGHHVMQDNPEAFNRHLVRFLNANRPNHSR